MEHQRILQAVLHALLSFDMSLRRIRTGRSKQFTMSTWVGDIREHDSLHNVFNVVERVEAICKMAGLQPFAEFKKTKNRSGQRVLRVTITCNSLNNLKLDSWRDDLYAVRHQLRHPPKHTR